MTERIVRELIDVRPEDADAVRAVYEAQGYRTSYEDYWGQPVVCVWDEKLLAEERKKQEEKARKKREQEEKRRNEVVAFAEKEYADDPEKLVDYMMRHVKKQRTSWWE